MTSVLRPKYSVTLNDPKTEVLLFWDECAVSLQQWDPHFFRCLLVMSVHSKEEWYTKPCFERPRREQIMLNGTKYVIKIVKNVKFQWESL